MIRYEHLVGLDWEMRKRDCYALVRRFYEDNYGITLRPYAYPEEWWHTAPYLDLFMRNFEAEGFLPIGIENQFTIRTGDVVLIARGTPVASHCGVWIGGNRFLHHPHQGFSLVDTWAGKWAGMTLAVVRHHAVPEPVLEKVDVMDLLPPHKRAAYRRAVQKRAVP